MTSGTALVFPGQGSQRPGMGLPWRTGPDWDRVEEAGDVLGRDVGRLLLTGDGEELRATREAQVATFLVSVLALLALRRSRPDLDVVVVAGHSLGEYTALVAAGVLTFADGLRLVAERGEAMRAAAQARPGTMAAVLGLPPDVVGQVLADVDEAWPANDNAPAHVVVSGSEDGVARGAERLRAAGARRVLPLPVGGAFHTPLMAPARPRLEEALGSVAYERPRLPVLANVTAAPYGCDVAGLLSAQLTAPVRWRESVLALAAGTVVELGPGSVLTGLVRRTRPDLRVLSVARPDDLEQL